MSAALQPMAPTPGHDALVRRLRATRARLGLALAARAMLWGAALALVLLATLAAADLVAPVPLALRGNARLVAALAGVAVTALLLRRDRPWPSLEATALWVETRLPALHYALVTAAELPAAAPRLTARVAAARWEPLVRQAALRALAAPAAMLGAAALALALLPAGTRARALRPHAGDAVDRVAAAVRLEARRDAEGDDERWRMVLAMPATSGVLRLTSGARERLLLLAATPDSAPVVVLERPERDSVLRAPTGRIALSATASDDIGLASAGFEYIVSAGSGESFTFRSGTVGARAVRGARATLAAELVLDSLGLKPGDVVHLSAVARDRNTVAGPALGRSETRALRVARAGEYDSVAVEAAPPAEADKSVLSQRMLLQLTEELQRRRPRLQRPDVVDQSQRIAADQRRLRRRVGALVFARAGAGASGEETTDVEEAPADSALTPQQRLMAEAEASTARAAGGGALDFEEEESPVVSINRPLLEAYNHMWDAARELEVGEPGRAIPPMRRALAAIERARQAERLYLRGRPLDVVVDVARARGQGKRPEAPPSERTPRAAVDPAVRERVRRVDAAIVLLARDPAAAVDSLLLVRAGAIGEAPALSAALGQAIEALRGRRDATDALARARRLSGGEPARRAGLPAWSAAP